MRIQPVAALLAVFVAQPLAVAGAGATGVAPGSPAAAPLVEPFREESAYWVFFIDKEPDVSASAIRAATGGVGAGVLSAADMLAIAQSWTAEVRARRARGSAKLPDVLDAPVSDSYVRTVAEHGRVRITSRWLNAVSVDLSPDAREHVRALPFVADVRRVARLAPQSLGPKVGPDGEPLGRILQSRPYRPLDSHAFADSPADYLSSVPWIQRSLIYGASYGQLSEIQVPPVHDLGYSGNRVTLMMLDTGFRKDHSAFASTRLLAEWDFVFDDGETQNEPEDDPHAMSHGTLTWGTCAGFAPRVLVGPAYGATCVLAKTEDIRSETRVEEDFYVAALEWADALGVAVTSASLAYDCFDGGFCYYAEDRDGDTAVITIALDIAAARGITCVNCMGNYGCAPTSLGTPADADSMLAVGAVDSLNVIAEWSACGPTYDGRTKPEVLARGRHVFCPDDDDVNGYGYASGTSLSTPLAGGSVALLLEAHPEWGPMDVRAALLQTADRADHPDNQYGWGRINVLAALHSEPVRYPVPFSLISPADDSQLDTRRPALVWHASDDPLSLRSVDYSVWIDDPGDPAGPWSIEAGTDTSLTLPFSLDPETTYRWEVVAESQAGYRRTSRENLTFTTSAFSATREDRAAPRPLPLLCGPNPFRSRIDFVIRSQESLTPIQDRLRWNIFDATGRKVASGETPGSRGEYAASWDGLALGKPAAAGVYYLEARLGASLARETIVRLEP